MLTHSRKCEEEVWSDKSAHHHPHPSEEESAPERGQRQAVQTLRQGVLQGEGGGGPRVRGPRRSAPALGGHEQLIHFLSNWMILIKRNWYYYAQINLVKFEGKQNVPKFILLLIYLEHNGYWTHLIRELYTCPRYMYFQLDVYLSVKRKYFKKESAVPLILCNSFKKL